MNRIFLVLSGLLGAFIIYESTILAVPKVAYFLAADRFLPALVYCGIVVFAALSLISVLFLRTRWLRLVALLFFAVALGMDRLMVEISGRPLNIDLAKTMLENMTMAADVTGAYFTSVVFAFAIPALIALVWAMPVPPRFALPNWIVVFPALALALITGVVHFTRGGATEFISPYAVPAKFAVASILSPYDGPRDKVVYSGSLKPKVKHVVLIVDESVRGDAIGLNGWEAQNTPTLSSNANRLANFGVSVASWNCSKESRLILRSGLQPSQIPDLDQTALRTPSIWQYAKAAGYQTVLIDAWGKQGRFHSFMNAQEASAIDERVNLNGLSSHERDAKAAELLLERMGNEQPKFILVNKYGVHFPYYRSHPSHLTPFDMKGQDEPGSNADREILLNSYNNAVHWSVDAFFNKLISGNTFDDAVILYTSDHGQSLFKDGYKLTHCSKGKVDIGEALVPLFAVTDDEALKSGLVAAARMEKDQTTHFQIFPTLLTFLGYEADWVKKRVGPSLYDSGMKPRKFMTGDIFSTIRGGKWVDVD